MTDPTAEQIAKLPKWAQERIRELKRALDVSRLAMADMLDSQSPSLVWYEELVSDSTIGGPSIRRVYIQTDRIMFGIDSSRNKILTVSIDHDEPDLYRISADSMQIMPRAYNSVEIKVGERR